MPANAGMPCSMHDPDRLIQAGQAPIIWIFYAFDKY